MKQKITRRTSLKAIAASAVAGGAWLTNLAVPELIHAASKPSVQPRGTNLGVLKGVDLESAVAKFLASADGLAVAGQVSALGYKMQPELANGGWFVIAGVKRFGLNIPYGGASTGVVGAIGSDLGSPEEAGLSHVEQLSPDVVKATSYTSRNGTVQRTHVFVADRANRRLEIHDVAAGTTRTVTHADIQRIADGLNSAQTANFLNGIVGPTVANADACGFCTWFVAILVGFGGCTGLAWLTCLIFLWDPPAAAACAAIVGVFGGWVLRFICWSLTLGFGASYGCYELGYCSCPYPWGC